MTLQLGELCLAGDEVLLRPLAPDDAPALALAASESRASYGFNPVPDGPVEAAAYIATALRQRAAGLRFPFTVLWRGRIVGTTSYSDFQPWIWPERSPLQRHDRPDAVEVGYTWLAMSAQRTRCNTESKYLLLQHAFESWEVHRVTMRTDERNERSRRAIERLGAKLDGVRRADMPGRDGTVRNSAYYSVLIREWPVVSAHLRALLKTR
jgi:N-acetyltransferase